MFNLLNISVENFRSFRGEHSFELPTAPGLYNVTGRNKDNPRLGANGIGKSSFLLDAVHWCLYGTTCRGLKASDIVTYDEKTARVQVEAIIGEQRVIIKRAQSPNSLTLTINGKTKPVEQTALQKVLRLSPAAFTRSVMFPQFLKHFFDLKPTEKLEVFTSIMELDLWLEKSGAAAELAKEIAGGRQTKEQELSHCQGQVQAAVDDIAALREKQAEFATSQEAKIKTLEAELMQQKRSGPDKQLKEIRAALVGCESRAAKTTELAKLALHNYEMAGNQQRALRVDVAVAQMAVKRLIKAVGELNGLGATCPTCNQTVTSFHLKAEQTRLKRDLIKAEAEVKRLDTEIAKKTVEVERLDGEAHKLNDSLATINRNRDDFTRELHRFEGEQNLLKAKLLGLEDSITAEVARENPYTAMLATKKKTLSGLKQRQVGITAEIDKINEEHAAVSFWISGFKRIRLHIIEDTLRLLELEINNNLASLGLTDWQITLDVERENKSGGVTKGFVVFVYPPGRTEPVKFEAWSGGETQRLRLAGDLGLANLIMERAGLHSMLEIHDEPSQHMSTEGLLDLAETLAERAEATGRRLFLVDHHIIDFGGFTGTIKVIKDNRTSSIK